MIDPIAEWFITVIVFSIFIALGVFILIGIDGLSNK